MIEHLDATPARVDIRAWQGDSFALSVEANSADEDGNLTPFDLTGITAIMDIKRHAGTEVVESATYVAVDEGNGKFLMELSQAQMADLDGSYVYDVEIPGVTILWGSFYVGSEVTVAS